MRKVACWLTMIAVVPVVLAILNILFRTALFNSVRFLVWAPETLWRASTLLLFFAMALLLLEMTKPKA